MIPLEKIPHQGFFRYKLFVVMMLSSGLSDLEILELVKKGNQQAFVVLYDKYWSEMYSCAFQIFPHREVCEDLIHDVFISLWNKREALNIQSVRDYLYISIRNRVFNIIRSRKLEVNAEIDDCEISSGINADQPVLTKEIHALFEEGMLGLPERCRQILIMSRKQHLSNREIAQIMNISTKTVENQINIALKRIRVHMEDVLILFFFIFFR